MAGERVISSGVEWRVTVPEGASIKIEPEHEHGLMKRAWLGLLGLVASIKNKIVGFAKMVWKMGSDDPRRVIHGLKVGIALALVSLFYYTRPLYEGVGGSSMWAVMTVVVVFEFSIGGCLYKGINRGIATLSAGALAIGIHWIASKSGEKMEPFVRSAAVFLLASAATFTRFIPAIKRWFDYGITIFILTFSLVAVSGYRVDKLVELAVQRLSTIAIGISICFLVAVLVCPVWSGYDLHVLITRNMDKLACSVEACVDDYFKKEGRTNEKEAPSTQCALAYKCILNSKASEDSLANLARWEPGHGRFSFRHPWGQYLKIAAAMRQCAYCIEALNGCINSELVQAPETPKHDLSDICMRLSSECSKVLKESSNSIKKFQRSLNIEFLLAEMNDAVQELHNYIVQPPTKVQLMEALQLITVASLLTEIAMKVEGVADEVDKLATIANFKAPKDEKPGKVALQQAA